ncbi:MAG: hypothetical protein AAF682_19595 [Planctomycetota bacterium]
MRLPPILLTLLCLLPCACSSTGGAGLDARASRDLVHDLRTSLEPLFDELVAQEDDPELAERYGRLKVAANAIEGAWDSYLEQGAETDREELVAALNGALDLVDGLLPLFEDDEPRVLRARSIVAAIRIVVLQVSRHVGDVDTELRAELTDGT